MISIDSCQFYCLSFNNKERYNRMINRFKNLNIECKFYKGVSHNDNRINKNLNKSTKRNWSITYSHLDMIGDFYFNSDKKFAIICEDDICIHKDVKKIIHNIINDFNILGLDILLLSYMLPYKIGRENLFTNYKLKVVMPEDSQFKYHEYPEYLSGTQMYMINKKYAYYLIDKYYFNYAGIKDQHFISDKILIKEGNKALIYPMIAVEDENQDDLYHQLCHKVHFTENYI